MTDETQDTEVIEPEPEAEPAPPSPSAVSVERLRGMVANEADPEEEEAEEATPPAPEPEPEPEPVSPEEALNAEQTHELEKALTAYHKRVSKAFGGDLPYPECAHCQGVGFDLSGGAGEPEYRAASDKETCEECDGLGGVRSGSQVPGNDVVMCERCKGAGYLIVRQVNVTDENKVAPVVVALQNGNADSEQAAALKQGDPGWEPWMGDAGASRG